MPKFYMGFWFCGGIIIPGPGIIGLPIICCGAGFGEKGPDVNTLLFGPWSFVKTDYDCICYGNGCCCWGGANYYAMFWILLKNICDFGSLGSISPCTADGFMLSCWNIFWSIFVSIPLLLGPMPPIIIGLKIGAPWPGPIPPLKPCSLP